MTSLEIDAAVRASLADGRALYAVDAELIDTLAPDLILTQDLCAVCAVSSADLGAACPVDAEVLSLDPRTYADVAASIRTLAARLGVSERGEELAGRMEATLRETAAATRGLPRRRVFFAEWVDPPFCAGHWLPEMIEAAGGEDVLGRPGQASFSTTWAEVVAAGPELVIAGPCGFGVDEAAARAAGIDVTCRVVAVDGDAYYSRPGPRLADGVRQLAQLLHPGALPDPGLPAVWLRGQRLASQPSHSAP
jgi:iron complex transport system substrate-binding protein